LTGVSGPVILHIGGIARARVAIGRFSVVAGFLLYLEAIMSLAIFPDAKLNLERTAAFSVGCLLLGAQIAFLWPGLLRLCQVIWRAYGFLALVTVVFVVTSIGIRGGWLYADQPDPEGLAIMPFYFLFLSVVLIYPVVAGLRGFLLIERNIRKPLASELLVPWLFGRKPVRRRLLQIRRGIGRALLWFTACALAYSAMLLRILVQEGVVGHFPPWVGEIPVPLPIVIGSACLVQGLRSLYKTASEIRMTDARAPVLILRAFRDDKLRSSGRDFEKMWPRLTTWFRSPSFEELLADEFQSVGPPIIVGAPGERLPRLGASRAYFADREWKDAVGRLIEEAVIVIIIIGDTESLFWELSTAVARRTWNSVILVVPPVSRKKKLNARLRSFVSANCDLLGPEIAARLLAEGTLTCSLRQESWILIESRKRTTWHYELAIRLLLHLRRESGTDTTYLASLLKNSSSNL